MPSLVVLAPHPDDESYPFAGTIALAAAAGWRCTILPATAGEGGECAIEPGASPARLAAIRLAELETAARILGADVAPCLGLPDGGVGASPDLPGLLEARLRVLAPDLVLALGPDGAYGHPDHLALHAAALVARPPGAALAFAAFPRGLFLPQYELCRPLLGDPPVVAPGALGSDDPPARIDIRTTAARKLAAIAAHRSQLPGGDPHRLFPPGIVGALLDEEWLVPATPADLPALERLQRDIAALAGTFPPGRSSDRV